MSKKTRKSSNALILETLNQQVNGTKEIKKIEEYTPTKKTDESQVKFTKGESVYLIPLELLVPSSDDINVFDPWDEETMLINKESIRASGLYNPIIVVANEPNEEGEVLYTILAGHNRTRAYTELRDEAIEFGDEEEIARFSMIPAFIKPLTLTEEEREEIVIETNVMARTKLGKKEEMMAYQKTAKIFERRKTRTGQKLSDMIRATGIKKSTFYEAIKITEDLSDALSSLYYKEIIGKKSALLLASLKPSVKTELEEKYIHLLNDVSISKLSKKMEVEDLKDIFEAPEEEVQSVVIKNKKFEVDVEDVELFEEWFEEWSKKWKKQFEKYKTSKLAK